MSNRILVSDLISDFQTMLKERWAYGAETKYGQVDCSGAFVWSYSQHGHSIYHGGNRIARTEIVELIPIADAKIVPGMAAFKRRKPGESGYALPSGYQPGGAHYNGDLNDYYHIGLVDEDTTRVLNAQSAATGFVASDIGKGWSHVAYLKQVDYNGTDVKQEVHDPVVDAGNSTDANDKPAPTPSTKTAYVTSENGKAVKMREKPSESCRNWKELKVGTVVTIRGNASNGWTPISYGGKNWYMMSKFLTSDIVEDGPTVSEDAAMTSWAAEIYDLTKKQADAIKRDYPTARIFETHG